MSSDFPEEKNHCWEAHPEDRRTSLLDLFAYLVLLLDQTKLGFGRFFFWEFLSDVVLNTTANNSHRHPVHLPVHRRPGSAYLNKVWMFHELVVEHIIKTQSTKAQVDQLSS